MLQGTSHIEGLGIKAFLYTQVEGTAVLYLLPASRASVHTREGMDGFLDCYCTVQIITLQSRELSSVCRYLAASLSSYACHCYGRASLRLGYTVSLSLLITSSMHVSLPPCGHDRHKEVVDNGMWTIFASLFSLRRSVQGQAKAVGLKSHNCLQGARLWSSAGHSLVATPFQARLPLTLLHR